MTELRVSSSFYPNAGKRGEFSWVLIPSLPFNDIPQKFLLVLASIVNIPAEYLIGIAVWASKHGDFGKKIPVILLGIHGLVQGGCRCEADSWGRYWSLPGVSENKDNFPLGRCTVNYLEAAMWKMNPLFLTQLLIGGICCFSLYFCLLFCFKADF